MWTVADRLAMRGWVAEFLDWWLHSPRGQAASTDTNNIGTTYTLTAISMALYSDQPDVAAVIATEECAKQLAAQITLKGLLPQEDDPHDLFSFGYHVGDLVYLLQMAFAANLTSSPTDFYHFRASLSTTALRLHAFMLLFCLP